VVGRGCIRVVREGGAIGVVVGVDAGVGRVVVGLVVVVVVVGERVVAVGLV